ncbi:MAG: enhanced serine sensitivity protein SseB C-terminal domain-containing protein [Chloroflexi bacterium]|nr:enhanced serine sensitivity protein SseB C-terminal domain-containing protein [Chloroflexota bacterium]
MTPTNPNLVRAMQAIAANDAPENRHALYENFLASELIVPVAKPIGDGKPGLQIVDGATPVDFIVTHNQENQVVLFAFTDADSINAWKPSGSHYIAIKATDLFQMAIEMNAASIVVNLAGPAVGGELMRWEFQALAAGVMPKEVNEAGTAQVTIPPGTRVAFGAPEQKPSDALIAALKTACAAQSDIAASYLFEMQVNQGDPHLVVGVKFMRDLADDAIGNLINTLGDQIAPALEPDHFVDFVVLGGTDSPPIEVTPEMLVFERA